MYRTIWPSVLALATGVHLGKTPRDPLRLGSDTHPIAMDRLSRLLGCLLLALLPLAAALKFDLHPVAPQDAAKQQRCVRNFVAREQLVVVTAILDGYRGDGQRVDMHVCSIQQHDCGNQRQY